MSESSNLTPDSHHLKLVEKAIATLMEHFDSVHIFATKHEPTVEGGTIHVQKGDGNWYTRYGHIKTWTIQQDEREKEIARQQVQRDGQ